MFFNTFLRLSNKAKIDDSQALDILYEKLSDEFKDRLIIIKKIENLNNLILFLHIIDTNMKKINKQSQLRIKSNASNFLAIKPSFKSFKSASTELFTIVRRAVISLISNTVTKTHRGPMNVTIMIRQRLILQKEKNRRNKINLYYYYNKLEFIAIDHRNPTLLATQRQVAGVFIGNLITLVLYKPLFVKEKNVSLG